MAASNKVEVAAALAPVVTSEEGTPNTLLAGCINQSLVSLYNQVQASTREC